MTKGQLAIVSNVNKQAYIQGIDDDFLIAAFITIIGGIPILFLRVKKNKISINIIITVYHTHFLIFFRYPSCKLCT